MDLEDLEELTPGTDDLSLFNAKDSNGNPRFNAPIPFGTAPELEFIIEDFLPSGILGMVVATGGSGKTMFLTQLAYCVASGRNSWECGRSIRGRSFTSMPRRRTRKSIDVSIGSGIITGILVIVRIWIDCVVTEWT